MHSPKPVAADPAIAAAQAAEQQRAEDGQVSQTQKLLSADTVALRRRFGTLASAMGSAAGGGNGAVAAAPPPVFGLPGVTGTSGNSIINGLAARYNKRDQLEGLA